MEFWQNKQMAPDHSVIVSVLPSHCNADGKYCQLTMPDNVAKFRGCSTIFQSFKIVVCWMPVNAIHRIVSTSRSVSVERFHWCFSLKPVPSKRLQITRTWHTHRKRERERLFLFAYSCKTSFFETKSLSAIYTPNSTNQNVHTLAFVGG